MTRPSPAPTGGATRCRIRGPRAAALLAGLALGLAPAAALAVDDPALDQTVEADEESVEGRVVIEAGHVDLGPRFVDGEWRLQLRDDREMPPVWRYPHDVVFHLTDAALLPVPDVPEFAFLGVPAGDQVHVIPQTEDRNVPWLGWNSQDPEVIERLARGATLTLHGVAGPGDAFLFLQEGVALPPNVLLASTEPEQQDLWMEPNVHVHANWVFTEPGVYHLEVEMHAELVDGATASDTGVLRFAVGGDTDPQSAFEVDGPIGDGPPADTGDATSAGAEADEGGSFPVLLIAVLIGAVVLVVAVALVARSDRRARRRAASGAALAGAATGDPRGTGERS